MALIQNVRMMRYILFQKTFNISSNLNSKQISTLQRFKEKQDLDISKNLNRQFCSKIQKPVLTLFTKECCQLCDEALGNFFLFRITYFVIN